MWAGETAEFDKSATRARQERDKSGKITSAYLGTRSGNSDAVGDDIVPGGNKFTTSGYNVGAFIHEALTFMQHPG